MMVRSLLALLDKATSAL